MKAEKQGEWDFYFAQVNDAPGSVFLDLSAARTCPDPDLPWLISVFLHLRFPRADGLSSDEEAPTLRDIERSLVDALAKRLGARFVGRVTGSARRDFFFYAPSVFDLDETVASALAKAEGYEWAAESREDPEWDHFQDVLFPSPEELQWISDRHLIDALASKGDALSTARLVEHHLYFETKAGRGKFAKQVAKKGFRVAGETEHEGELLPFAIEVTRKDAVTLDAIHDVVLGLMRAAEKHGGEYDGWGCGVVKPRAKKKAAPKKNAPAKKKPAGKKKKPARKSRR